MPEKIYPELNDNAIAYEDISDRVNKTLSDARIKEIETKRHELEMNLKHKKILKRWKKLDNGLKISSVIIVGSCSITSIVLGFGAFTIPLVLGILASIGGIEGIISESIVLGVVKKKKYLKRK